MVNMKTKGIGINDLLPIDPGYYIPFYFKTEAKFYQDCHSKLIKIAYTK